MRSLDCRDWCGFFPECLGSSPERVVLGIQRSIAVNISSPPDRGRPERETPDWSPPPGIKAWPRISQRIRVMLNPIARILCRPYLLSYGGDRSLNLEAEQCRRICLSSQNLF
ncbi:hypothetical protein TNCT_392861 [Trichonephila clavata]|uniref:Uncharacterized protein n=1 Tax=Trichonephila clavata TaxID=2740835 RepID=A0A8X6FRP4_TRICU|nr:hypothetical protein TNCT_392861 [Trichonephila clavata]